MRGGNINPNYTNKFNYAGQDGGYWSSRAKSDTAYVYYLYFDANSVYPSSDYNVSRHLGRSLRCLIPTA